MNSLEGNWLSRGARTFAKLVGTTAALGALLATACSSNSSELGASDAVGSGGTTAVQTPASEPGTAADQTSAANFDVAAAARAFMASHPVRPPRPLDFSATDGSAGQGGEDAGASPAPAFAALNKVLDLPGLPSAPTPYPLSEDGKYYKVNLLHRNFLPPTASATFSSGVHQLGAAAPTFVFDGGDQAFTAVTDTPGDPNVVVTLLVDMGQYFSVGAVRPLYPPFLGGGYPFRQRIRLATKLGPNPDWRTPVEESPVPTTDTTLSFDATCTSSLSTRARKPRRRRRLRTATISPRSGPLRR